MRDRMSIQGELMDLAEWFKVRGMVDNQYFMDATANAFTLRGFVEVLSDEERRQLRAIINGKISRRTITQEQQDKMQAARKKPNEGTAP